MPTGIALHKKYVPAQILIAWMKENNYAPREAGEMLGFSTSGIAGFIDKNRMPAFIERAIQIFRQNGPLQSSMTPRTISIYIALIPQGKEQAYTSFCQAMDITTQEIPVP
jgi:hypothetical protein